MRNLLVGSIGIALLLASSVFAQEKFAPERVSQPSTPKIFFKEPALSTETKPQPFLLNSRQLGWVAKPTAQQGDFKQRLIGSLNLVIDRGECPLPNERCIANTSKRPKLAFVTKKFIISPTFQANLSSRWWERKISGGFRFQF
jgi:hypothetical protein